MDIKLKGQLRSQGEKLGGDSVAAVVYGSGLENILLKLNLVEFNKVFSQAGESNLIDLEIEGQSRFKVLIKETQKDPVKNFFIHADFYKVDMAKEISTEIPLVFIGESKAVKEAGAMLNKAIDAVSVECLPSDLVDHIDIDISVLSEVGHSLQIKDIAWPAGIKVLNNEEDTIVSVSEAQVEEEAPATAPEAAVSAENQKDGEEKKS